MTCREKDCDPLCGCSKPYRLADVQASGPAIDGELHVDLEEADFLAVFPLAGRGRARLIGTVRDQRAEYADTLRFEDVSRRIIDNLKVEVENVNWFSTYRVHHRVTELTASVPKMWHCLEEEPSVRAPDGSRGDFQCETEIRLIYNLWEQIYVGASAFDRIRRFVAAPVLEPGNAAEKLDRMKKSLRSCCYRRPSLPPARRLHSPAICIAQSCARCPKRTA